jgi:hypothetical protein
MNKLYFTVALGAAIVSAAAGAQAQGGGWQQQDMNRQQAQQMADGLFQRLDVNHDGVVTRAEAEQAAQQAGGGGGGRFGRMIERSFGTAQSLTLPQFESQALARFDAQDLNHDGVVTAAERQQGHAQRGGGGEGPGQ